MAELERFKLSNLMWDGDADEDGFFVFLENFGTIARSTPNGPLLEDMLDSKLRRAKPATGTIAAFILNDPDFAVTQHSNSTGPPPSNPEGGPGAEPRSDKDASTGGLDTAQLCVHCWWDFHMYTR